MSSGCLGPLHTPDIYEALTEITSPTCHLFSLGHLCLLFAATKSHPFCGYAAINCSSDWSHYMSSVTL